MEVEVVKVQSTFCKQVVIIQQQQQQQQKSSTLYTGIYLTKQGKVPSVLRLKNIPLPRHVHVTCALVGVSAL